MHDRKLRAVWEDCFRPALTRPGFISLVVLLSGWVLTDGTHAVTSALRRHRRRATTPLGGVPSLLFTREVEP